MKIGPRPRATLGLKTANIAHLLLRARTIRNGIAANPAIFQSPTPSLAVLDTRIDGLDQAQQETTSRTKGKAAARDLRAEELVSSLFSGRAYVQGLVDQSPAQGVAIIEAAGMFVGAPPGYTKPPLAASQERPGAPVRLVANVGVISAGLRGKVFFRWQSSADSGKTWDERASTAHGTTELSGLVPLTTISFRCCANAGTSKASDWSQAVALLVR